MNRIELLNLKRRLIALSLAGGCLVGLTGCIGGNSKDNNQNDSIINSTSRRKDQFLCIFEDKALIIEPKNYDYDYHGASFNLRIDDNFSIDMKVSLSEFKLIYAESPFTAEDYVALVCGPDFPIEYIRSEDYNLAR